MVPGPGEVSYDHPRNIVGVFPNEEAIRIAEVAIEPALLSRPGSMNGGRMQTVLFHSVKVTLPTKVHWS